MTEKKKQVLFLARLYYPHIGGVEKHIAEISKILSKKNYQITVVCEQHDKTLKKIDRIESVKILRIPISESEKLKKFFIWRWILRNRKLIKSFDIIHIHDVSYWILPILFILDRKKIFITFHGYESFPIRLSEKIQKRVAAKYCSGSIAVGEFINKWYKIASNAVIYGGVNSKNITAKTKKSGKLVNILYVGRLTDDMGASIYLRALKNLNKKGYNFSLEICGDGIYKKEYTEFGKVHGFVRDLRPHIRKANIVFSSSYLTMLEVLINKKPIFAVYGNPLKKDYLKLAPFYKFVSVNGDSESLLRSIESKIDEGAVQAGYSWAKKQTWDNVVEAYEKIWKL